MMNMIRRDDVLTVLAGLNCPENIIKAVKQIPSFPAPNPDELNGRNIMGQTEEEFWDLIDRNE